MATPPVAEAVMAAALSMLDKCGGNQSEAARRLGIPRETFRSRIEGAKREAPARPSAAYDAPNLPSPDEPIDEIISRARSSSDRIIQAHEARKLIPIKLTMSGPIGLFCMGDPHLDNKGRDFRRLEADLQAVANQPRVMAVNIGDVTDNWIGRLERLHASSSITAHDAWRLAEWLFNYPGINWLGLVGGNHDVWSGSRDPLNWITKGRVAYYENDELRFAFQHPNGETTRVRARHNFKGHSQWNDMHGLKKEVMLGWRDHLLVAGHLHLGEDNGFINPDGFVSQLVRLSGYKVVDDYAKTLGFKPKPLHPSALIIINPDRAETDRGRVWIAPDIEEGVAYLNWMAARAAA